MRPRQESNLIVDTDATILFTCGFRF